MKNKKYQDGDIVILEPYRFKDIVDKNKVVMTKFNNISTEFLNTMGKSIDEIDGLTKYFTKTKDGPSIILINDKYIEKKTVFGEFTELIIRFADNRTRTEYIVSPHNI